jgi:hypothetical protein
VFGYWVYVLTLGAAFGVWWRWGAGGSSAPSVIPRSAVVATALLVAFAAVNAVVNWLYLGSYLYYAKWYAVAETVACVVVAGLVLARFLEYATVRGAARAVLFAVVGLQVARGVYALHPQAYEVSPSSYQHEAWVAQSWMSANIQSGERVASANAGLLGFFVDGPVVVNVDGLANTAEFVRTVYRDTLLARRGLTTRNALWDYIRAEGIRYAADAEFARGLGTRPLLGAIPPANYQILYTSERPIDWRERGGLRRFVVARLTY